MTELESDATSLVLAESLRSADSHATDDSVEAGDGRSGDGSCALVALAYGERCLGSRLKPAAAGDKSQAGCADEALEEEEEWEEAGDSCATTALPPERRRGGVSASLAGTSPTAGSTPPMTCAGTSVFPAPVSASAGARFEKRPKVFTANGRPDAPRSGVAVLKRDVFSRLPDRRNGLTVSAKREGRVVDVPACASQQAGQDSQRLSVSCSISMMMSNGV
jgi:hypothetical protein